MTEKTEKIDRKIKEEVNRSKENLRTDREPAEGGRTDIEEAISIQSHDLPPSKDEEKKPNVA